MNITCIIKPNFCSSALHTEGAAAEEDVEQGLPIAVVLEVCAALLVQELGGGLKTAFACVQACHDRVAEILRIILVMLLICERCVWLPLGPRARLNVLIKKREAKLVNEKRSSTVQFTSRNKSHRRGENKNI